jgi:hypothetical protein
MKRLIALVAVFAVAAVALAGSMTSVKKGDTQGVWATGKGGSTVCLYGDDVQGAVLGFYLKESSKAFSKACDFAIASNGSELYFQITDNGKVHHIPVTALLKLKDIK